MFGPALPVIVSDPPAGDDVLDVAVHVRRATGRAVVGLIVERHAHVRPMSPCSGANRKASSTPSPPIMSTRPDVDVRGHEVVARPADQLLRGAVAGRDDVVARFPEEQLVLAAAALHVIRTVSASHLIEAHPAAQIVGARPAGELVGAGTAVQERAARGRRGDGDGVVAPVAVGHDDVGDAGARHGRPAAGARERRREIARGVGDRERIRPGLRDRDVAGLVVAGRDQVHGPIHADRGVRRRRGGQGKRQRERADEAAPDRERGPTTTSQSAIQQWAESCVKRGGLR